MKKFFALLFALLTITSFAEQTIAEQTIVIRAYAPQSAQELYSVNPSNVKDPKLVKEIMVPTDTFIKSFDKCFAVNREGTWEEVVTKDYIATQAILEKSGPVVYYIVHNGVTFWELDPSDLPKNTQFKKDKNWEDFRYAFPLAYVWDGTSKLTKPKFKPIDISQVK